MDQPVPQHAGDDGIRRLGGHEEDLGVDGRTRLLQLPEEAVHVGEFDQRRLDPHESAAGAPTAAVDESLQLQDVEGVAHGHAGHAELVDEITFRRQPVAGKQFLGIDAFPQRRRDRQIRRCAILFHVLDLRPVVNLGITLQVRRGKTQRSVT